MKLHIRITIIIIILVAPGVTLSRQSLPSEELDDMKREDIAKVDEMRVMTQQMVDQIYSYSELGFQEYETSNYLTDILESNGFTVNRGVAGVPTAWVGAYGSGKPV